MHFVHMMQRTTQSYARVRLATQTQALVKPLSAQVKWLSQERLSMFERRHRCVLFFFVDVCQVNNGGCGTDATCIHEAATNVAKCICKPGYINIGSASNVICIGIND